MQVGLMDYKVDVNADTAGCLTFGTWAGWWITHKAGLAAVLAFALPPWVAQMATSLLTIAAGAVLLHFLKPWLQRHWPREEPKEEAKEEATE